MLDLDSFIYLMFLWYNFFVIEIVLKSRKVRNIYKFVLLKFDNDSIEKGIKILFVNR